MSELMYNIPDLNTRNDEKYFREKMGSLVARDGLDKKMICKVGSKQGEGQTWLLGTGGGHFRPGKQEG